MYKIAVIGDKDSIYGFAAVGLEIFPCEEPQEAVRSIRKMAENGYGVIYITEKLASQIDNELDTYRESPLPSIIPIPGTDGNTGMGLRNVSKFVEQAVGSDILSDA
ncbi:MAG: V-type ATP synthase subunit F [Clostridia bacterium]|nr:V-type ATP synthase subunit F [Clostridia bacterium]